MSVNYASHVGSRVTPQSQPIPGSNQVQNSAGGFSWSVDCWTRLQRFLILGNEGGSYYASERALTVEAAGAVRECFQADAQRTVEQIVNVSVSGRAPKNDPAIFALALLSNEPLALKAIPQVCRIGTHLFQFVEAATKFRGWGRSLRNAVAAWYTRKEPDDLAYQLTKYQQRNGWSHHDMLHKCHAKPANPLQSACFRWSKDNAVVDGAPALLSVVEEARKCDERRLCELIREYRLAREVIPTEQLNSVAVWEALLANMPATALLRNLGKMSSIGLLKPLSSASQFAVAKLTDAEVLKKSRVHPIAILMALYVYKSGRGVKGSLSWAPDARIVDALDDAYYKAFASVEPTGKRYLLALDVSGSMSSGSVAGTPLTPRDASAAMSMVTVQTDPMTHVVGFTGGAGQWRGHSFGRQTSEELTELGFTKRQSLDDAVRKVSGLPFGGTDCALPMLYALKRGIEADVFVIYTDNETWAGNIHPTQALRQYREKTGINAKLIVCGMVANGFTIADPNDRGMLDVVGFDASVPQVMSDFAS